MAYAEKRGRYWRGRYRTPPGVRPQWGTVSAHPDGTPFTTKREALRAATAKETELARLASQWTGPAPNGISLEEWLRQLEIQRTGRDPAAGDITLKEWVEKVWWPAQDLEPRTVDRYDVHLRRQILPTFGSRPIRSLTSQAEIAAWELSLRSSSKVSDTTAASARTLLATILGDAMAAGLVDTNAAARPRGRGRKKGRGIRRKVSDRAWVTPLEALLVAERCALVSGRDDDLVLWITAAWCGLRWGELIGLRQSSFRLSSLVITHQLSQERRGFRVTPPKDESYRTGDPGFFGPVDLPPFLSDLLSQHLQHSPPRHCRCTPPCGGERWLFLGPDDGHYSRQNYSRRIWHPAVDGVYPAEGRASQRPVLVDMSAGWPGVPLRPAWPYAEGEDWQPPSGRGWTQHTVDRDAVSAVACPNPGCRAEPGQPCRSRTGRPTTAHRPRRELAAAEAQEPILASWLPLKPGLTPHGLRHSHKVWLDEAGIPAILAHDRMGHVMPGIGGTYSHVSPAMREELRAALQKRWEEALAARAELSPTSPVRTLDRLLAGLGRGRLPTTPGGEVSRSSPNRLPVVGRRPLRAGERRPLSWVEPRGFEPLTPGLQSQCSAN